MAVIKLGFRMGDVEERGELVPPGTYLARIESAELGESQSGNPKMIVRWRIAEGDCEGRVLVDNVPLHVDWRVARYGRLVGAEEDELDTDELVGVEAVITVRHEEGLSGGVRATIARIESA